MFLIRWFVGLVALGALPGALKGDAASVVAVLVSALLLARESRYRRVA